MEAMMALHRRYTTLFTGACQAYRVPIAQGLAVVPAPKRAEPSQVHRGALEGLLKEARSRAPRIPSGHMHFDFQE